VILASAEFFSAVLGWIYFALVVAGVVTALLRKEEPAAALGWSLAIVFVPVVGLVLFAVFGVDKIPRRLRRIITHHEAFDRRLEKGTGAYPADRWGGIGRMVEGLGEAPRRTGNEIQLFDHGGEAFLAMADAIRAAEDHIHVEFFIFRNDDLGRMAIDSLAQKARQGVEVRLLVDAVGSRRTRRLFRTLERAGGQAGVFLPVRPLGSITPNLRNHRKIIVCDGKVGFFGGLNVGTEYLGRFGRKWSRDWVDFHARMRGPAVRDLQRIFVTDWDFTTHETLVDDRYFPAAEPVGDAPVQIVSGGPDQDVNAIRQIFFAAITRARKHITIVTPYVVPDLSLRDALMSAARSGVRVKILTQWPPADHYVVHLCGEWYMHELLEAGVEVRGYEPGMLHAKAMVVDGEWGMLGTANLDNRSLHLNFEQMAIFDGEAEVRSLEAAARKVEERSAPYTLDGLAARPPMRRALSHATRLIAPLL